MKRIILNEIVYYYNDDICVVLGSYLIIVDNVNGSFINMLQLYVKYKFMIAAHVLWKQNMALIVFNKF